MTESISPDLVRVHTALVTAADKRCLAEFVCIFQEFGIDCISTGGTAQVLRDAGARVTDVTEYTGYPILFGGFVKTLHPLIHGGLLMRHYEPYIYEARLRGIKSIELVVANCYTDKFDNGGPALIRSAASNFEFVAVVINPNDYDEIGAELCRLNGCLSLHTRKVLAVEALEYTAAYDTTISRHWRREFNIPRRLDLR